MSNNENTSTPAKRRPHESSPVIGDNGVYTKPGDNSKFAALASAIINFPQIDKKDINALETRLQEYIQFCIDNDVKLGNMACYAALGIDKGTARDWENEQGGASKRSHFIKKVKMICGMNREFLMQNGKINPVTGIFWQKNYDGLKDEQEIMISASNPLGNPQDPDALKQKYLEAMPKIIETSEE